LGKSFIYKSVVVDIFHVDLSLDEGVPMVAAGALVLVVGSLVEGRFHVPKRSGRGYFGINSFQ
jgi:hypothetical protein